MRAGIGRRLPAASRSDVPLFPSAGGLDQVGLLAEAIHAAGPGVRHA